MCLIQSLLTPFSFVVLVLMLCPIWVFFLQKMLMYWNALIIYFCCELYKKAISQPLILLLIKHILYYADHLLKFENSLLLIFQQYIIYSLLNVQYGFLLSPRGLLLIYMWGENSDRENPMIYLPAFRARLCACLAPAGHLQYFTSLLLAILGTIAAVTSLRTRQYHKFTLLL